MRGSVATGPGGAYPCQAAGQTRVAECVSTHWCHHPLLCRLPSKWQWHMLGCKDTAVHGMVQVSRTWPEAEILQSLADTGSAEACLDRGICFRFAGHFSLN